ncbi:Zn-dependent hydrolase [Hoeflea prorocentri]|uniref:Zn-dependent hydrolase n=1 Tax=Hoeflea prorocentri TaxID=1922333 RepID=A0A9X3UJ26_9HYPH|nr:Zn-dependent hydrolase [Hoeflea prorocentri]MCY6379611.1 Zn-dependent hydrolase [Hoeflea prorocentri]MDA5397411.1 Zn-dependent hydrolase [Hoeflea prorocentri]
MDSVFSDHRALRPLLLELLNAFGEFGKAEDGGYSRLAASPEEKLARDHLCEWLRAHDFAVLVDPIGNIFGVLDLGEVDTARAFFCGSHLDSQPNGGNYDGCLGVVCACIAALFLKDKIDRDEIKPTFRYYVVVCWTGEEGARFQPSLIGSSVFSGALSLQDAWRLKDSEGVTLKDALAASNYLGADSPPSPDHYLELHIEQGPELEKSGDPVALVEACWGAEKLRVLAKGKAAHTGPTPMDERNNALLAASQLVVYAEEISRRCGETLYSSVGRMELAPNSPNTVVERAELWLEFRSPGEAALSDAVSQFKDCMSAVSGQTGCDLSIVSRESRNITCFDEASISNAECALGASNTGYLKLKTVAGHDAVRLQAICPSTLLFVPSKGGITHSPSEYTADEDVCAGFDAMAVVLASLIARPAGASAFRRST